MTDTTLCKETIKFLIESLEGYSAQIKADQIASPVPQGDWDRGYITGINLAIRELTQQLQND
jgi:hypothetical protein